MCAVCPGCQHEAHGERCSKCFHGATTKTCRHRSLQRIGEAALKWSRYMDEHPHLSVTPRDRERRRETVPTMRT